VKLDWKWIGIGVLIMIALSLVAGLIAGLVIGSGLSEVENIEQLEDVSVTGGQILLLGLLNLLSFLIGGYIVGVKSAGRTILEPGISAALAVVIALAIGGSLSVTNILIGGLLPFLAGVFGGWLGERRQEAAGGGNPSGSA